jgi:hypothetical protein
LQLVKGCVVEQQKVQAIINHTPLYRLAAKVASLSNEALTYTEAVT